MPSIDTWIASYPDYTDYSMLVHRKMASIVVIRNGTPLAAQNVRIETWFGRKRSEEGDNDGQTGLSDGVVFGYKNHPTIPDTNLQFGDRFKYDGHMFDVIHVVPGLLGQFQALLTVRE